MVASTPDSPASARDETAQDGETAREASGGETAREASGGEGGGPEGEFADLDRRLSAAVETGARLSATVEQRTIDVAADIEEDAFFRTEAGRPTVVNRYDLEKAVATEKKRHFREIERYWVNEPHAFVIVFHSAKENERKYYAVEPHVTAVEEDLIEFVAGKLRTGIKYASDSTLVKGSDTERSQVIARETEQLLDRYDLRETPANAGSTGDTGTLGRLKSAVGLGSGTPARPDRLQGSAARPEPALLAEDSPTLSPYQVEKLRYRLRRDFIGYERIDPIKHDVNVEDISCDGYSSPVFVYHSDHEQLISNISHGEDDLDDFVVKLAQRSGKGISKRQPQVDATLPDGSRAQLTLGKEVSDHGTNYTIRQFKDVPNTPVDLINWNTFSLEEMAYLWLCIENNKSMLFAGGTASGKTTSLNAMSLFIPSKAKIVTIENTRELEIPQRNWIASVTRPSFTGDDAGNVDEFDLLEAALRQRPEYIVMGEVRGEEGRTLFQVMSTGHTSLTTFHADNVGEVIKRFTTEPINVSKTLFTALDLVSVQTATRVRGQKVRRSKAITEINYYDAENDEINVQDVYQWQAETDEFLQIGTSSTLEEIKFDRGWSAERLDTEIEKRRVVLSYLIDRGIKTYTEVAATLQAFINDPDTILTLIANDRLERSLEDLQGMESVSIETDPETEAMVPRPDAGEDLQEFTSDILEEAEADLFEEYYGRETPGILDALPEADDAPPTEEGVIDDAGPAATAENAAVGTDGGSAGSDDSFEEPPDKPDDATDGERDATDGEHDGGGGGR